MPKNSLTDIAKSIRLGKHIVVPLIIVVFCLLAFWQTTLFERVPPILKRGIQPSDFPQLIIALILVLTAAEFLINKFEAPKNLNPSTWYSMILILGFVFVAELDFILGLGVFAVALAILWGERRAKMLCLVGIVVPFAVFLMFDQVFEIRFPRGLLTSIWYG